MTSESEVRSGTSPSTPSARPPIGIALAGGAAQGAIYEIGALRALDEALDGIDLNHLGVYVGVSAGGFLSACLANGLSTDQMCRAIVKEEPGEHPFVPEIFFKPAIGEIGRRIGRLPGAIGSALRKYVTGREKRLLDALTSVGRALPVGLFDNRPIGEYVEKIFSIKGRTNDFRKLDRLLSVVATDIESGRAMRFGFGGWDHIPISKAVQASTALPGLYPPVEIQGRSYVDGILLKTMHASVALEAGAELVFCINPVVPVDVRQATQQNLLPQGHLVNRGLTTVMAQTVRTVIHSRMNLGIKAYETRYPGTDVVLIEPRRDDHEIFFSNIFSFSSRRAVCERAYQATRKRLLRRQGEIDPILRRHGLRLDLDVLHDQERDVWLSSGAPELSAFPPPPPPSDIETLDELEDLLARVERLVERQPVG